MSMYLDMSDQVTDDVGEMVKNWVEAVSIELRDEIVKTMDPGPTRTGRTYAVPGTGIIDPETGKRKHGTGQTYTASAPGQPPAVRTGAYRDSWKVLPWAITKDRVTGGVFSDAKTEDGEHFIGEILEYGAPRANILPRPHIRPALDEIAQRYGGVVRTGER